MRILLLCNVVPYPPRGGVHLRIFHLLTRIAKRHDVVLGCHAWCEEEVEGAEELTKLGIPTVTGRLSVASWKHVWPAIGSALIGHPPEMVQYQTAVLHSLVNREQVDIVQVEETLLTPYLRSLPRNRKAKTVLTFHNVHWVQARRIAGIEKASYQRFWRIANARWMRHYEPSIAARFDRSIVVSEVDRQLLLGAAPGLNVTLIPNGVDTGTMTMLPPPDRRPAAVVFVGTFGYRPCVDGAEWLVQKVLPILRRIVPDVEVWIVGRGVTEEVEALGSERVFVTGEVPETAPYYRRAAVSVVPLRAGGGSRLKILEAMAFGRPVVSTTMGAEGLSVRDGETILIADSAEEFAAAIVRALEDERLWHTLVDSARRFVEESHDWDAIAGEQLKVYEELHGG